MKQEARIYAVRDIMIGEEITISYGWEKTETRVAELQKKFGFSCACELCGQSKGEREASNTLLREVDRLEGSIMNVMRLHQQPSQCLGDVHSRLRILEKLGIAGIRKSKVYGDAFQIVLSHGDLARARAFAERYLRAQVACLGEDSMEAEKAKEMVGDPEKHVSFTLSKRWLRTSEEIPTDMDATAFGNWLWATDSSARGGA